MFRTVARQRKGKEAHGPSVEIKVGMRLVKRKAFFPQSAGKDEQNNILLP